MRGNSLATAAAEGWVPLADALIAAARRRVAGLTWRLLLPYVTASLFLAAAVATHEVLQPITAEGGIYILFILVITLNIALIGPGPGVWTLGITLLSFLYLEERKIAGMSHLPWLALILITAGCSLLLSFRLSLSRAEVLRGASASLATAEELGLLIDAAVDYAIYMLDEKGRVVHWNRGAQRIRGWREDEVIGRHFSMFYGPVEAKMGKPAADMERAHREGRYEETIACRRKDGSSFQAHSIMTLLHDDEGRPRGYARLLRDVTYEREHQQAIEAREARLRSVLDTVPHAMIVMEGDGTIRNFSAAAEAMFGYDECELIGGNVSNVLPVEPSLLPLWLDPRWTGRPLPSMQAYRRDGVGLPIEITIGHTVTGTPRLYTVFIHDLTEREATKAKLEALQMEVLHGARRSAMGAMASTLAHEINQPMTTICNYIEGARIALGRIDCAQTLDPVLTVVSSEALRVAGIVSRLRNYVDRGETMLEVQKFDNIVLNAVSLFRRYASLSKVTIELDQADDAGPVFADGIQIQQVLINLCKNAIDAMTRSETRVLTISTRQHRNPEYAVVSVTDTGTGLAPGIEKRLFQAFVTSKDDGLGVGLSICRTIVEAHGGRIWAQTVPGRRGTTFSFTLARQEMSGL